MKKEIKVEIDRVLSDKIVTIPNVLSMARIIGSSKLAMDIYKNGLEDSKKRGLEYSILALSDKLDGYIARNFDQVSELGKVMDPIADKILNWGVGIALTKHDEIPKWVYTILIRDVYVASKMKYKMEDNVDLVTNYGKLKMLLQSCAIGNFLLKEKWDKTSDTLMKAAVVVGAVDIVKVRSICKQADDKKIKTYKKTTK